MRIGWLTDVHLNFVNPTGRRRFYETVRAADLDLLLLGGDVGEAGSLLSFLAEWSGELPIPTYFVLGNHDFYRGSIPRLREAVTGYLEAVPNLHYLSTAGVVDLGSGTALIGHDSWADGRLGEYFTSPVMLNDYVLIEEFLGLNLQERFAMLNRLGDEAAAYLDACLTDALRTYRKIFLLTHVPPFREACWHEGRISNDGYLPHFACRAVGERLHDAMAQHLEAELTVLCGHTHSSGIARIRPNLTVHTAAAIYGEPALAMRFLTDEASSLPH